MKLVRFTLFVLTMAAALWVVYASLGFIRTLDVWLVLALLVGCWLTVPFIIYTLACAPDPDPVQMPHIPTEDDFI